MQIEKLQELVRMHKVMWSNHSRERMKSRGITKEDVISCILQGEIIEDYPNAQPCPGCLIYGKKINGIVIHVVIGTDNEYVYIITTYYPKVEKFEIDLKTRRK